MTFPNGRGALRTPAVILTAGALLLALSLGIRHTFGLFLAPMTRDNGWTREIFALAIALQNLVWGAAQPFAGRLADRLGAGRTIRSTQPAPRGSTSNRSPMRKLSVRAASSA